MSDHDQIRGALKGMRKNAEEVFSGALSGSSSDKTAAISYLSSLTAVVENIHERLCKLEQSGQ